MFNLIRSNPSWIGSAPIYTNNDEHCSGTQLGAKP